MAVVGALILKATAKIKFMVAVVDLILYGIWIKRGHLTAWKREKHGPMHGESAEQIWADNWMFCLLSLGCVVEAFMGPKTSWQEEVEGWFLFV